MVAILHSSNRGKHKIHWYSLRVNHLHTQSKQAIRSRRCQDIRWFICFGDLLAQYLEWIQHINHQSMTGNTQSNLMNDVNRAMGGEGWNQRGNSMGDFLNKDIEIINCYCPCNTEDNGLIDVHWYHVSNQNVQLHPPRVVYRLQLQLGLLHI